MNSKTGPQLPRLLGILGLQLWIAMACLFNSTVWASAINHLQIRDISETATESTTVAAAGYSITAPAIIFALISIGLGTFLLFWGFKLYRPTVFLIGFVFGAAVGYMILKRVQPEAGYPQGEWVLLFGSLAVGLLVGSLLLCIKQLAVTLIGAAAGLFLALWLLGLRNGGLIRSDWGRLVLIAVCIILGIIAAIKLEREVVIIGTSITGSYLIVFGIDLFAQTGFTSLVQASLGGTGFNLDAFSVSGRVIALAVTFVVLAIIGSVVQHRMNKGKTFG